MSNPRENILERIRSANRHISQSDSSEATRDRIQRHARGPQPQWNEDVLSRFTQKAEQAAASVELVNTDEEIVEAVTSYLSAHSLGEKFVCAGTPLLGQLRWPDSVSPENRLATIDDKVVFVEAYAGIAETGSIVMCSGKATPASLNFLPDHFLCVVHKSRIVNNMEDVWEHLRREGGALPRAINIITGPSRTADVEQIIQMGAHGPRQVHLLLQE